MARRRAAGFTLVELLVVITIIGILAGLIMSAVQNARENARRADCLNKVRNLAQACQQHEQQYGFFPSGGWGPGYVGQPTGVPATSQSGKYTGQPVFGSDQPGGWQYSILPFLGLTAVYNYGLQDPTNLGEVPSLSSLAQSAPIMVQAWQATQPLLLCTTRRKNVGYNSSASYTNCTGLPTTGGYSAARSDYAGNAGSANPGLPASPGPSPSTLTLSQRTQFNGVIYQWSQVRDVNISDGKTNTYLLGERYMDPNHYGDGQDPGDGLCAYAGHSYDTLRWTGNLTQAYSDGSGAGATNDDNPPPPSATGKKPKYPFSLSPIQPAPDTFRITGAAAAKQDPMRFGSAHAAVFNMAFCDGRVLSISYAIDAKTHQLLGSRNDSQGVDEKNIKTF